MMQTLPSSIPSKSPYQLGGSLPLKASTYVQRQADEVLLRGLLSGKFCYVFNSRQMGKSSLRIRTLARLQERGVQCYGVDLTGIGSQQVTAEQWYGAIAAHLTKGFKLSIAIGQWWRQQNHLPPVARLGEFIETVLLVEVTAPIVIFIDEIDSILGLKFATDDFFALIRTCFNRRADQPAYRRLTFALFGVTTPCELITDKTRTPFNIGQAIALQGFSPEEAVPLAAGLADIFTEPRAVLNRILYWTGGHPFLTQKLCAIAAEMAQTQQTKPLSNPEYWVDGLVQQRIVNDWELQDEPEHLRTIRDRLWSQPQRMGQILGLYQQVLAYEQDQQTAIASEDTAAHVELRLLGLVIVQNGYLRVHNRIYQTIFNPQWIREQFDTIRPYAAALNAWIHSDYQDTSRLLRGNALQETLAWSQHQRLGEVDYRFLAASQAVDRQETIAKMEAARLKEVESRLALEHQRNEEQSQSLRKQRILLMGMAIALVGTLGMGIFAWGQSRKTALSEIQALIRSSEALFSSERAFEGLLEAIRSQRRLKQLGKTSATATLQTQADGILERILLNVTQENQLRGHTAAVLTTSFSPDGQRLATAGIDKAVRIWSREGTLLKTLTGHQAAIRIVRFSADGQWLASAGDDGIIHLWSATGELQRTMAVKGDTFWALTFSPDSQHIVAGGTAHQLRFWDLQGNLLKSIDFQGQGMSIRAVAYFPKGDRLVVSADDGVIHAVTSTGEKLWTTQGHEGGIHAIAVSPDGELIISGGLDHKIKLWQPDGTLQETIDHHAGNVQELVFTPDGQQFVSASWDKTLALWNRQGRLVDTFNGHQAPVWGVAISPDGQAIASAGADNAVLLWKRQSLFKQSLHGLDTLALGATHSTDGQTLAIAGSGRNITLISNNGNNIQSFTAHEATVLDLTTHPTQNLLTSASEDKTLKLWQFDGQLVQTLQGHTAAILSAVWQPNGKQLISGDAIGKLIRWNAQGEILQQWQGHEAPIWDLAYHPDGSQFISAANDGTVRLWDASGNLQNTIHHGAAVWRVAYSADGQVFASGSSDMTAKIWRNDGTLLHTLSGHQAAVWMIAFSPDNQWIATASMDETVKLWSFNGELMATLKGGHSAIRSVLFNPDGKTLEAVSDNGLLLRWDLRNILQTQLLPDACHWVQNYLKTNGTEEEQSLCNDVL